ncbi:MAG: hypothetical protein K1X89_27755, partial [Myxococcaceae bacterium]|nr:hypothetical protein [Myxococcaceae bacterium]
GAAGGGAAGGGAGGSGGGPACSGTTCGTGCSCVSGMKHETACGDGSDNDGDTQLDCADLADCTGQACGTGCTCAAGLKKETACGDGADNDGDLKIDCADPDCVGTGTESCTDGVDNTCDRAIDCGDVKCMGNAACANLQDGKACRTDAQCAGGRCNSEAIAGVPNGSCTNAVSCTVGSANTGCNGGQCVAGGGFNVCRPKCTGTGLGTTGRCRPGFACSDVDSNTGNNNNVCIALCSSDAECEGSGTGYGCNPFSKLCESKDKGKKKYGQGCSVSTDCESGICLTGVDNPGGYCVGLCRGDSKNCAPNGLCNFNSTYGDNVAVCYQGCSASSECRVTTYTDYACLNIGAGKACDCYHYNEGCFGDRDCCSGSCTFGSCD